ncbi:MAG: hypothetical protein R3Y36_04690 [Spirochaetales bacterium]
MKKNLLFVLCFIFVSIYSYAQNSVTDILSQADTVDDAVNTLKSIVYTEDVASSRRLEAAQILAPLQEQLGDYKGANLSYSTAASLAGVQTVTGQRLLLGTVRCALSVGDVSEADFLLSTAFPFASEPTVTALIKLYAVWSWIIKAENEDELAGPISVLQSYVTLSDMQSVKPSLLLTLYHLTDDEKWAEQLKNEFPDSPEVAVVLGEARLLPAPFWFFMINKY